MRKLRFLTGLALFLTLGWSLPVRAAEVKLSQTKATPIDKLIKWQVSISPGEARRGETVKLTIHGKLEPGYHTYPTAQPVEKSLVSKISLDEVAGLKLLGPVTETKPEVVEEEGVGKVLEYKGEFTWTQDIQVLAEAAPGEKAVTVRIKTQVCDARKCVPATPIFEGKISVSSAEAVLTRADATPPAPANSVPAAPQVAPSVPEVKSADKPAAAVAAPIGSSAAAYQASLNQIKDQISRDQAQVSAGGSAAPSGLLAFILSGVFWGAVSLVTPCVFPMIPITVSFFLKQSEKAHYRPVTMALVYCLTIVVVLTVAAAALLSFFRWLSVNPIMNFALGGLFVVFALSLFGMYDLELPSGLARFTSAREGKGGLVGVMFMALTFTIVSFACVAPFLGGFGGTAANSGFGLSHRLLGGLAFAATFASPFFILALFPNLLKQMPRSGSWLNSVKVVMGFLELAAALKFFRAGELIKTSMPAFFTYDLVLGMWIALALLCGLYLLNLYRLPHDSPAEKIGVPRLVFGFLFLSLSFYLLPALFRYTAGGEKQRPTGTIYAWIDSFLLPEPSENTGDLAWSGNLPQAIEEARAYRKRTGQTKLVFVDFTGETCTNCKFNENSVFSRSNIQTLFHPYSLVQMFTDKVPDKYYSADLRSSFTNTDRQQEDARTNLEFQNEVFQNQQLPLYVILEPLPDGTIRVVDRYEEGKINNVEAFAQFLKKPVGGEALDSRADAR
jgi:thiol:disulfide interchange protein DsbD